MLELGQPMHAFDINSIEGKHITVRRAKNGEKVVLIDADLGLKNLDVVLGLESRVIYD